MRATNPLTRASDEGPIALVLDANQRSALAVTRSLGRRGVPVLTADATQGALAGASRYSRHYLRHPSPIDEPSAFLAWLADAVAQHGVGYLQPVTEVTSQLILRHRDALPPGCQVPFPALDVVMSLTDKGTLLSRAAAAGIATPDTRFIDAPERFDPACVTRFPVVLKPRLSRVFLGDRWIGTSVAVCRDRVTLQRLVRDRTEFREHPFLLQEFIPGGGAGVFALYHHGNEVAHFAHRRLREKPPSGGVSVLSESITAPAALLDASRRLLADARWHGVAMVEFRVTPEGAAYLMEVNTRFWGSLQLAIDAGVDFPWLLYRLTMGHSMPDAAPYRTGRRLRWWLGDLDSLYLALRDPSAPIAAKLKRAADFLTPHPLSTRHETFRWHDPRPAWHELARWVSAILQRNG